ncbi:predicted protein [Nematostella vectensis]|uniref:Fibronectin type-III domain-containing protein n=1 Tax=Nematostella vectensis TaxID=45351 RepID=A7S1W3_NEMVE|nr:predicted protein [Nematostella vectensis]|eukprot:XP_001634336.1 predicted protein [Nematostella vectensis]
MNINLRFSCFLEILLLADIVAFISEFPFFSVRWLINSKTKTCPFQIDLTPVSREEGVNGSVHSLRLDVREPRIRRVRSFGRIVTHPVNEELERKLIKPFYFRQYDHGSVVDAIFPKDDDPQALGLKKGIAGSFQVDLKSVSIPQSRVQEHDDSGVYHATYTTLSANDTDATLKREWSNHDYVQFADGTPVSGEHKVQFRHEGIVHVQDGRIKKVHRTHKGVVRPAKGNPRVDNIDSYQHQDIEMSTSGYSKLTLVSCKKKKNKHRARRAAERHRCDMRGLHRDNLVFADVHKVKTDTVGGEKIKFRPFYELIRCFSDKSVEDREVGLCAREIHKLVKYDDKAFQKIRRLVLEREHQNTTTWAVLTSALAAHGKLEAQETLAHALMSSYPRPLTDEEYEALLEGIFFLPQGPLHKTLFDALLKDAARDDNPHKHAAMPMLVLAGLVKRAHNSGYNTTLSDNVAELIHNSYQNKTNVHHPDSPEHEHCLRRHIWAFGNLGHLSGLDVILRHINHDSSGIRSAVVSAMRKLPEKHTDEHLFSTLFSDEHTDVKAAVFEVFVERHQNLSSRLLKGIEHALWHANEDDSLDSIVNEFLENHGDHPHAKHMRRRRSLIRRQKRALFPALRPREFRLGQRKRWVQTFGGKWLGAESQIQFLNQVYLSIGIFGGRFEVNIDNYAKITAHILKFSFDVVKGKAAFKASASFKNDIPKDLIHAIADAGDDILAGVDSITSIIIKYVQKFQFKIKGYVPLYIDKFVDFVNKLIKFVENLVKPLRPINLINKILKFAKDIVNRLKNWKWLLGKIKKIQISLSKLTIVDEIFRKVLGALDRILDIVNRISIHLPHNLPPNFQIKDLLRWLKSVSVRLQDSKIADYFKSLGFSVPGGFRIQLPFRFAIRFSFAIDKFTSICIRIVNFGNNFLDMSSIFDALRNIRFPRLSLPELEGRFPKSSPGRFNFGLSFDWRINLKFKLNLKSPGFLKFLNVMGKLVDFLKQFKLPSFDLEKFFEKIMPGKELDLKKIFQELFGGSNSTAIGRNPADILQDFIEKILDLFDSRLPNITAISDITDFFKELGPATKEFAEESVKKVCAVYKFALNSSSDFKDFGENMESQSIAIMKTVKGDVQNALDEIMNFTITVDSLIDEIEKNFTVATRGFVSDSLGDLSRSLKAIQDLADDVVDFANGTASKVSGVCDRTADFSADIIDEVQNISKVALGELGQFIGPVAVKVKKFGQELKVAIDKVEKWYTDTLSRRVGKLSKISRIIADLMSILNTEKGFLGDVKKVAVKVNDILLNLDNIPQHANRARKTADDIINFADRAQNFKNEIKKLDIRKQFGIDYDTRVRQLCNEFKILASDTLDKIGGYDIAEEVNGFFTKEADKLINKAVSKFRQIKEPITEVQEELRDISTMVDTVMDVLINLKPFSNNLSPILATIKNLPDCGEAKKIFLESVKPCVKKAGVVGKYAIAQYKDMRKEIKVLFDMIPETWKSLKIQKCIKGAACIPKAFIDQVNVIKDKVEVLKEKFQEASGYTDMLATCKAGADNITAVVDTVKNLTQQIKDFDIRDDIKKVKDVLRKVTGREVEEVDIPTTLPTAPTLPGIPTVPTGLPVTPPFNKEKNKLKRIIDIIKRAKETKKKMEEILENTFKAMRTVYDDAILQHTKSILEVRRKLQLSYDLWKKTKDINTVIQALNTVVKGASNYAENIQDVTSKINSPIVDLLTETGELSNIIEPHMTKYVGKVTDVKNKVDDFLNKVTSFLNKIQLRQKGLNMNEYKPWSHYPYCSEAVCLRPLRRSSKLYLDTIFTWKYPHLDDLSSVRDTGKWLIPGLFDDYKVEGIAQISDSEMLLGMYGVSANEGRASLLVVTDTGRQTVKKIIQLGSQGSPFTAKISGVAIAREFVWISDKNSRTVYRVSSGVLGGSSGPIWAGVSSGKTVEGTASSVSYDEPNNMLWVTVAPAGKAYGYKLSANGDLFGNLAPDRTIVIGPSAQGMALVHQFGTEYVVVARCLDYQCKLEFHDISAGDEVSEGTISRVVRTPTGLESVQKVTSDRLVLTFSSGTFSEQDAIERIAGDFEDRYFRIKTPVLKMTFGIQENCLYFKVWFDYIIEPRRLFPYGNMICGALRKRSVEQQLLESDIYSQELEKIHSQSRRSLQHGNPPACLKVFRGNAIRGYHEFYSYTQYIPVFIIIVVFEGGAGGYYFVDYYGELCMRDKVFKAGLIPGAWISAHASASAIVFIVQAGISIEAIILESYLLPELEVRIDKWPLQACISLKLRMTPLKIRVWLWYRLLLCIRIRCKLFWCSIKIEWCSKKTFKEWWWSARMIEKTLFTNCHKNIDKTPPTTGSCVARQAGDKKYFVQWQGFTEDTRIQFYRVMIGSIRGSGDDFGENVGLASSKVVRNLPIMHGRDVFISVVATNGAGLDSRLAMCTPFKANRQGPQIRAVNDGTDLGKDVDFQSSDDMLGTNFVWRNKNDVVDVKWGISSGSKCTLDASEADIYPMTSMGESLSIQTSGLSLTHGHKYYTRVYAMNKIGLKTLMCSDGVTVDKTPPVPGYLYDGADDQDADYLPSLKRVRAKYEPFKDPESPIVKYEWKVVDVDTGTDLTSFTNILLSQRTPLMEGLSLAPGTPYKIVLKGTNAAGLTAVTESDGFKADQSPPNCQEIIDVQDEKTNIDVDFVRKLENIQAKWSCTDKESGIASQEIAVGTYPGGDDIRSFKDQSLTYSAVLPDGKRYARVTNITAEPGVRYHVTVKVVNGAGLCRTLTTDGILIDTTPPSVAAQFIKDGLSGKDQNYTKERFSYSAYWKQAFVDPESSIHEYHMGVGTAPGLIDTMPFTSMGASTHGTLTGLLLESGQIYYVTVVGCNGVGMCVNASSNGAIVDFVSPHPGAVTTPNKFQWIKKSVWARWNWCVADEKDLGAQSKAKCANDSFYDVHTGISTFGLSVSTVGSSQILTGFKEVGKVRASGRSIDLEDGVFSVVVQATDKAGMTASGLSNTLIVDSTPPVINLVQHGSAGRPERYVNKNKITFSAYFEIEDDLSKVASYKVSVGSYSGADDVLGPQTVNLPYAQSYIVASWISDAESALENGRKYYITVQAVNKAGLIGSKSSEPLIADFEPPKNVLMMDGWGMTDSQYQSYTSLFRAHWLGLTDFSGVQNISLGLSSMPNAKTCDQHPLENVQGNGNYHVLSGLHLQSGSKYYACMKFVDNANNEAMFFSDGVLVDSSPPLPGVVSDGRPDKDIQVQIESSILRASWSNFTEKETDIVKYSLAFGTYPGKEDIQEFTDVGQVTSAASSKLKVPELSSGQRYYATVIAYNNLGIPSVGVSSDGVLVDFTPPVFTTAASDGETLGIDEDYTGGAGLKVTWTCEDKETGLQSVEVGFGFQPGKADVMNFTKVPVSETTFSLSTNLRAGYRYFATVRCINKVGLKSTSSSDGVTYDITPPKGLSIDDLDYQASTRDIVVAWKFKDVESGLREYHVLLEDAVAKSQQGPYTFNSSSSSVTVHLQSPLIPGHKYVINVTGVNNVGLSASLVSDGFVVDITPATCSNVWNGMDLLKEIRYVPKTARLVVSWDCYDNESQIKGFRFAVKDATNNTFVLPFHKLKSTFNATGNTILTGNGKWIPEYTEGHSYVIGIEILNAVSLKAVFWTKPVIVDSSPPVFKNLRLKFSPAMESLTAQWSLEDSESGVMALKWGLGRTPQQTDVSSLKALPPATRTITVNSSLVVLELGKTYFLSLEATNNAGLTSRAVSNGVVIDRTKPNAGVVTAQYVLPFDYDRSKNTVPGTSFPVSWTGFIDQESGIAGYSWAIGTSMLSTQSLSNRYYTRVPAGSVGGVIISNFTVTGNVTYYVCVRATNGAGLERTDCSPGITVILGKFSAGIVKDGPSKLLKDSDFQLDDHALWVHWDGFKDPVYGISSYEWCIGVTQPSPKQYNICKWPYMRLDRIVNKAHRFHNLTLNHGTTYYATVKAKNSRGESVRATSDGVLVDRSPPIGGAIKIAPTVGTETLYMTSLAAPTITWTMEDEESGMDYFRIGVGEFPLQDNLLKFTRVSGLDRSVDLDDLNFTTTQGQSFYVTLTGYNMLGLETTLTSQEVVVDLTPPEVGEVLDGNEDQDKDYQMTSAAISAHWRGFKDAQSDILEYQWCVGTGQGVCNVVGLTSVGLKTSAKAVVSLEDGTRYFVTVLATNSAGLKTTSYSDGVTIDDTSPIAGDVKFDTPIMAKNLSLQSDNRKIKVTWDKFEDKESGIEKLEWCVGNSSGECNIVDLTAISADDVTLEHYFNVPITAGSSLFVTFVASNGAGGKTNVSSNELLVDSTKPTIGGVTVGNTGSKTYLKKDEALKADWGGFEDPESGMHHYEVAACMANSPQQCITSFINVGLDTSLNNDGLDLKPGITYILVVRAFNKVIMYSEATSNLFMLADQPPIPGNVFDGDKIGRDISIQSSTSTMTANWQPFTDSTSRIAMYQVCVGDKPSLCNIAPFRTVHSALQAAVSGLSLAHKKTYYVTVQATNEAGYTETATSNGVTIDATPPVGGIVRDGLLADDINFQASDSFIAANWDAFTDPETGVDRYIWCAGTMRGSCDVIGERVVRDRTAVNIQISPPLSSGIPVYVTVSAVNGAGARTSLHSDGVTIDTTPPVITKVLDLQRNDTLEDTDYLTSAIEYCAAWVSGDDEAGILRSELSVCSTLNPNDCLVKSNDVGNRTLVCVSNLEFVEGVKYTTTIRITNNVGLTATKSSDGFILDTTPPIMGDVEHTETESDPRERSSRRFTSSGVSVKWRGFWDKESAVEKYHVCLGTRQETCDVTNYTTVEGVMSYSFVGLALSHNTKYFVSVEAENSAGLRSPAVSSDGVLFDDTAPLSSSVIYDGNVEGDDIDYQRSDREISANWKPFEDPESDITKVTWCAGSLPGHCDVISSTKLLTFATAVHEVLDTPMANGQRYYVTVIATNGAGEETRVTSDGVTIDTTPPTTGVVLDGNQDSDVEYVLGDSNIEGHWKSFVDAESGIKSYEVAICEAKDILNCPQLYMSVNLATNFSVTGIDLDSGMMYIIKVRATNMAGLQSEAQSNGFTIDFSAPVARSAWVGLGMTEEKYSGSDHLNARWLQFSDDESGIAYYEVCVGIPSSDCNVTDFLNVGLTTNYTITGLGLTNGHMYHVTVRGTNRVGQTAQVTTKAVLVDVTAPEVIDPVYNNTNSSNNPSPYVRFSCTEELLSVDWDEFEDPESGLRRYDWCVGKRTDACDVVEMKSAALDTYANAITEEIRTGTQLFAQVNVMNNAGHVTHLVSKPCVVITAIPKVVEVIDLENINSTNMKDIDYKADMESLTLRWKLLGRFLGDISRMKLEVAVTHPSSNESYPSMDHSKSWNGEPFAQNFMRVPPTEDRVTIRSLNLEPWEEYRGVVRVWNEGKIYAEGSTDGIRLEPTPPLPRRVILKDSAPEKERKRWLPNLRLPPFMSKQKAEAYNDSVAVDDVIFISSPSEITVGVTAGFNATNFTLSNETIAMLEANKFSPTKEFKLLVTRITSIANNTNATEETEEMRTLPGIANPEGPCCVNHTMDSNKHYSDTHFKPTIPVQRFGSSIAFLDNGFAVVGATGQAFVFSTRYVWLPHQAISVEADSLAKVAVWRDKLLVYTNNTLRIYSFKLNGEIINLVKKATISNCKRSPCNADVSWSNMISKKSVIFNDTVVVSGMSADKGVLGVFQERYGAWRFVNELGRTESDPSFGESFAINDEAIAVTLDSGAFVSLYSRKDLSLVIKVDLSRFGLNITSPEIRLTDSNTLVLLSTKTSVMLVLDIDLVAKTHTKVCQYQAPPEIRLSGSMDLTGMNQGIVVALGMQSLRGRDGVLLVGFHGTYDYHPDPSRAGVCPQLARVDSRENHFRFDDAVISTAVAIKDSKLLFGTPGVLALPGLSEARGTGRVYMSTYCPQNFIRTRFTRLDIRDTYRCTSCEGARSFGGFSTICTSCYNRKCASTSDDDPIHFRSILCDDETCPYTEMHDNKTGGLQILQDNGTFFAEGGFNEYIVKIVETTRADMSTTSLSESFIIDTTPPVVGVVFDGLGADRDMNCSANMTFGEDSQCSSSDFEDTDIDFTNNTSEVHARWIDFEDKESGIVEYFWCVGSQPMKDDIRECESTGMRPNGSHYGLDFDQGDTYYVTVVACNAAGRCSANSSNGVTIDTTPPVMNFVRDGVLGADMDYQNFVDIMFAYFSGSDPDSGILSYEVAWGSAPGLSDVGQYVEIGNTTTWYVKLKDNALKKGHRYYATVRTTNKAGLMSEPMSSDGVVVGKTEYLFDKNTSASVFFDTVNMNVDGTRKDKGVGKTYGTLDIPEGAVGDDEVKLKCYSLDEKTIKSNMSEDGPVSDPEVTKPGQFMIGNYSFQIKALSPQNNTPEEGYKFAKPIKISMFYDVDKLVNANRRVTNKEVTKYDIDPVLYLWNKNNNTWMDASLTCPEPWYHVNRTIKMLTVNVCHLTQFAFFWTFKAQRGLMLFEKNSSVYNEEGEVEINRTSSVQTIELPIKRSKGAVGNIQVKWSLYNNQSSDTHKLVWPSSGVVEFEESQWNATLQLNIASDDVETKERVIWVTLDNTTGGAILASREETRSKILISENTKESYIIWIIVGVCSAIALIAIVFLAACWFKKRGHEENKVRRLSRRSQKDEIPMDTAGTLSANLVQSEMRPSPKIYRLKQQDDVESGSDSQTEPSYELNIRQPTKKKRKFFSKKIKPDEDPPSQYVNPVYGTTLSRGDNEGSTYDDGLRPTDEDDLSVWKNAAFGDVLRPADEGGASVSDNATYDDVVLPKNTDGPTVYDNPTYDTFVSPKHEDDISTPTDKEPKCMEPHESKMSFRNRMASGLSCGEVNLGEDEDEL